MRASVRACEHHIFVQIKPQYHIVVIMTFERPIYTQLTD